MQQAAFQGESQEDRLKELLFKELLTFPVCLEEFCLFLCHELSSADLNPDQLRFTNAAALNSAWFSSGLLSLGNMACSEDGRKHNAMKSARNSALGAKEAGTCCRG